MLGRAIEAKKAAEPPRKPAFLEKQLFPSSSPRARSPNAPSQNGNIKDMFKKPAPRPFGVTNSKPTAAAKPLHGRSANFMPRATPMQQGRTFANIYNDQSDSFKKVEPVANRTSQQLPPAMVIEDDDFSDDNTLDLEFEAPSALPKLPSPRPKPQVTKQRIASSPVGNSSIISWSQSSPSHHSFRKAEPSKLSNSSKDPKRDLADDAELPQAKRRDLPRSWAPEQKKQDSKTERDSKTGRDGKTGGDSYAATPAPKPQRQLPWDTTASATKAQKKQLKNNTIRRGELEAGIRSTTSTQSTTMSNKMAPYTLSDEQRFVKDLVVEQKKSVFFTGPAGTGKSVLMRAIIQDLKRKHAKDPDRVAVTASTGLAACNIGGMTLHSFSGIGLGNEDAATLVKKIRKNPKAKTRWLRTNVLIIDEISMVDGDLFDKLSQIARTLRNNGRPWGGIQLVITGDFLQLPPVEKGNTSANSSKFAFDAATWNLAINHTIGLTEVFRQKDPEFASMLNEMRLGEISDATERKFKKLSRALQFDDGLEVTELFPLRSEVDKSNQTRLRHLPGESRRFDSFDGGDPRVRDKLLAQMMAPSSIELKVGAQVMLIKNMDETLVNGSLGTVVKFMTEASFNAGLADVGPDIDADDLVNKRKKALQAAMAKAIGADQKEYPLVQFHAVDGSSRAILCVQEEWNVELPTGEIQASRKQVPLILAWALSIHKAQGQTLERVKVNLSKTFEKGQAYVALSRATTQEGLQVLNFDKKHVKAHHKVVQFYNNLYSTESIASKQPAKTARLTESWRNQAYKQRPEAATRDVDCEEEAIAAAYGS